MRGLWGTSPVGATPGTKMRPTARGSVPQGKGWLSRMRRWAVRSDAKAPPRLFTTGSSEAEDSALLRPQLAAPGAAGGGKRWGGGEGSLWKGWYRPHVAAQAAADRRTGRQQWQQQQQQRAQWVALTAAGASRWPLVAYGADAWTPTAASHSPACSAAAAGACAPRRSSIGERLCVVVGRVSLRPLSARSCVRDASPASAMSFMSETNACGQTSLRLVCRVRGRGAAEEEGEGAAHTACVWESGGAAAGLLACRRRGQLGAG